MTPDKRAEYDRAYTATHREQARAAAKRYKERNREEVRRKNREAMAAKTAARSPEEIHQQNRIRAQYRKQQQHAQAGRPPPLFCEICGDGGRIVFDHDHNTGAFRGWICDNCNFSIGHARDNPGLLRAMANYLEQVCPEDPG